METVIPGLFASGPEALPFAPSLEARAFLLQRSGGNLLVYSAPTVETEAPAIAELGGVSRQYLNHWHETLLGCVSGVVGAPLLVNEHDRESAKCAVDETFSERAVLDGDFELIPIPGHTRGATAFLWDSGEQRALFTGDSIYLRQEEWVAAVLESSDRERYVESLALIRDLAAAVARRIEEMASLRSLHKLG